MSDLCVFFFCCCFFLQSLESLRLSRGELDRREQAVNSLRY